MQKEVLAGVATAVVTTGVLWGLGQMFGLLRDFSFSVEVPPGAVVAFDSDAGCPDGWSDVGRDESERFAGRTLIVSGPRVDRRRGEQTTLARAFDDQGGAEMHVLDEDEMPAHRHSAIDSENLEFVMFDKSVAQEHFVTRTGGPGRQVRLSQPMSSVGADEPHNNMPPYIALHFCKKEAG